MSLRELLSREGRAERALRNHIKAATNKDAQHEDRFRALEKLHEDGSEDAIYALFSRFGFVYDKTISDEAEKEYVFDVLSRLPPERALAPLRRYLKRAESIAWPLRILDRVAELDQRIDVLRELCEQNPPDYTRDPSKKVQLVHHCGDEKDPRVALLLAPYMADIDEGVRFAAAESLIRLGHQTAKAALLEALVRPEEESLRLKRRIMEGLAQLKWDLGERVDAAAAVLPDEAKAEGGRLVRKGG